MQGLVRSPRVLVVSHPAVVAANQAVYVALADRGNDVHLVVPQVWQHDYADKPLPPEVDPRLSGRVHTARISAPGSVQRHVYLAPTPTAWLRRLRPDVVFIEEEYYSVPAAQWGRACARAGIPFGVQADENLDRSLPAPARVLRHLVLRDAAFVAARSPDAARLVRRYTPARSAPLRSAIVPHPLPLWDDAPRPEVGWEPPNRHHPSHVPRQPSAPAPPLTIGYAGRFVAAKGIDDLFDAIDLLEQPVRLLLAGSGPLADALHDRAVSSRWPVTFTGPIPHHEMPTFLTSLDVLVLPSRTTETWAEQFGRVLVEAAWSGARVVGSSSGAIPWVVDSLACGLVFNEGDPHALAQALTRVGHGAEPDRHHISLLFGARGAAKRLDDLCKSATSLKI